MKSMKSILATVMAVALVASISSCGGGMKKDLCKKWVPDSTATSLIKKSMSTMMDMGSEMGDSTISKMEDSIAKAKDEKVKTAIQSRIDAKKKEASDEAAKKLDAAMSGMYIQFNEDGTFAGNMMATDFKGKWSLLESDKKLVRTMDGATNSDTLIIDELTKDKFTNHEAGKDDSKMTWIAAGGDKAEDAADAKEDTTKKSN